MYNQFIKYRWDLFRFNKNRQVTTKKMFITTIAFFSSLIIGSLFILTQEINPFKALDVMFSKGFENMFSRNGALVEMSILALSALSFIIAQKSGMFNVAVTGQLWGGAIFAYLIGQYMGDVPIILGQILMIIIASSFGIGTGIIITYLKTRFNVHEVVTSILFNYLVFFLGWFLLKEFLLAPGSDLSSIQLGYNLRLFDQNSNSAWIPGLILMFIVLLGTWFLFKYTKIGWKISAVGLSQSAAEYSGYNVEFIKMASMAVSGMIAAILGLLVYTGLFQSIQVPTSNNLPGFGFNGIAIGLLAMWNPIGIGFFSFIVGILNAGKPFLSGIGSTPIFMDLILGIIIYGSALISGLIIYKPWLWVIKKYKGERGYKGYVAYIDFLSEKIDASETKLYDNWKSYSKKIMVSVKSKTVKDDFNFYLKNKTKIINEYFVFKKEQKQIINQSLHHKKTTTKGIGG